jgi:hypothetical protein
MTQDFVPDMPQAPILLPGDARMLFVPGAMRAGWKWLTQLLDASPHVHSPVIREVGYFNGLYGVDADQVYGQRLAHIRKMIERVSETPSHHDVPTFQRLARNLDLMPMFAAPGDDHDLYVDYMTRSHEGQAYVADFTRAYARLERTAFAQMARIGSARFIYILRDPLTRLWSQFKASARTAQDTDALAEDCSQQALAFLMKDEIPVDCDYAGTLHELLSAVPDDRVHIAFQETLDRPESLYQISAFLDIPLPEPVGNRRPNASPPVDIPPEIARRLVDLLLPQYRFALEAFGDELPKPWLDTIDRYT